MRVMLNASRVLSWSACLVLLGCADQGPSTLPRLEEVPFENLDGATIMFMRTIPAGPIGRYVIDGPARSVARYPYVHRGTISPDGDRMTYSALVSLDIGYDTYVASVDGSWPRRLLVGTNNAEGWPSWTADGARVLFSRRTVVFQGQALPPAIRSAASDGSDRRDERSFSLTNGANQVCPLVDFPDGRVSQSPAGDFLLGCRNEIWVVPADVAMPPRLLHTSPQNGKVVAATYSPDGQRVAFFEATPSVVWLRVLNTVSGEVSTLDEFTVNPGTVWPAVETLCWAPNGGTIVFVRSATSAATHIYTVRLSGGGAQPFTARPSTFDYAVSCAR